MRTFVIRYSRIFPYPLADCYAWLTDYRDDDPGRAGAVIVSRPVLERRGNEVVLDAKLNIAGRVTGGKAVVTLDPPDHWVARFQGKRGPVSEYHYKLTAVHGGTRLDVEYKTFTYRWRSFITLWLGRPRIRRDLRQMWDGFAKHMAADFGPSSRPTAPGSATTPP
ncbi:MAG: hypothetical protein ACYDDF_07985 [Thermoplasmatota archaeon]